MRLKDVERAYKELRWYTKVFGFGVGFAALRGWLGGTDRVCLVRPGGFDHGVEVRVPSSDCKVFKQVFLDCEYGFDCESEPKVLIDAGANCGLTAVYFASRYPGARVLAIEPDNENFALLAKNVAPYRNIIPVHAALWGHTGSVVMNDPGDGPWSYQTRAATEDELGDSGLMVRAVTVGSLMEEFGIERIDLLKVDIEGSEKEVFDNSSEWIDRVDTIVVELHERFKEGCTRSLYRSTEGFEKEWHLNEHVWMTRGGTACGITPLVE